MNESGLTMSARCEITRKYGARYAKASKKAKGEVLDEVIALGLVARQRASTNPGRESTTSPSARQNTGTDASTLVHVFL